MKKPAKRDNAYFLARIESDHPTVDAEYLAGKFKSVSEARRAADMIKARPNVAHLKNTWKKSTGAEQDEFLRWMWVKHGRIKPIPLTPSAAAAPVLATPVGFTHPSIPIGKTGKSSSGTSSKAGRALTAIEISRIDEITRIRKIKLGQIAVEMGFSYLNPSLGLAHNQNYKLNNLDFLAAFEKWLIANEHIV